MSPRVRSALEWFVVVVAFAAAAVFVVVALTREPGYHHITVDGRECIVHGEAISCNWGDG